MVLPSILLLATLVSTGFAAPNHHHANVETVHTDLVDVGQGIEKLTIAINGFSGTLAQVPGVSLAADMVLKDIIQTTDDARAAAMFDEQDGHMLLADLQRLAPMIEDALTVTKNKKDAFAACSPLVCESVHMSLTWMNGNGTEMGATLIPKLPTDCKTAAQAVFNALGAGFEGAIQVYETC